MLTRTSNRSIVALLPTEEAHPRRIRAALQLYLRYGVHVIFYGDGKIDGETKSESRLQAACTDPDQSLRSP